ISGLYTSRLLDAASKKVQNLLKKGLLNVNEELRKVRWWEIVRRRPTAATKNYMILSYDVLIIQVVRYRYSNPMIQPEPEGSTEGYPLVSEEVLRLFKDGGGVLCKGNRDSIEVIKKSLEEFSKVSGRVPNLVRYLGVPLLAKKQRVSDCKVLCDKVEERINNWRNKTLSYAGRIQLIASVLSSMQQYWASVYLLPTTVINDLEKLFKRFLWNAGDSARGKARVSWKVVCRPKDQGGLGIKSSLKMEKRSIWDVNIDKSDSWGWKSMLKIRDDIKNHVWYDIGDGRSISMWYDRWCMDGPLFSLISIKDIYDARLDDNANFPDMISNNQ
ncbi:hypothetical protein Tco_0019808, partial [Tanacetum coccineum]